MTLKKLIVIFLICFVGTVSAQQVYINEILSTGSPDWIEVYNPSNQEVDISGWQTWDPSTVSTHYILPTGTVIPAYGYLVLLCDDNNTGLHTNYKLSSGGETVWIGNASGQVVDSVTFPDLSNNSGSSYGRIPDGSSTFEIFTTPTQGVTNGGTANLPPVIEYISRSPYYPVSTDAVTITAKATDDSGINPTLVLHYNAGGAGYVTVNMQPTGADNLYTAVVPAQAGGTHVEFYFSATDNLNAQTILPQNAPTSYYMYIVLSSPYVAPKVYINEIMASNATTIQDPDFSAYTDYIEIYNDDDYIVDLSNWYITDNLSNPTKYKLGPKKLNPKSYILIWADSKDTSATDYHTNFGLSKNGEAVGLFNPDAFCIDSVTFGALSDDQTYSRDGDANLVWIFASPTPKASNLWGSVENIDVMATSFDLSQNYPNPFNPSTKIRFSIPANLSNAGLTTLKVFDVLGNEVATLVNENLSNGTYEVDFNASGLSSGVYFYSIKTGNNSISKKMMLVK